MEFLTEEHDKLDILMEQSWYTKKISEVFKALESGKDGLATGEVQKRLEKYGLNKLPEAKLDSLLIIFLRQFQSPLIYILFIASFIVFFMKEFIDGTIILFVLLFNAIVGTIQEGKAQNTLLALKKFTETNTKVLRDGKEIVVPDYEVVPGDIIILQEGDKIPADARIIESNNLTIDEAALTGESLPVNKSDEPLSYTNLQIADQKNMVFKGTHIVAGNGKAIVVAAGIETVLGKISKEIAVINTEIPLKTNIRYLTRLIIGTVATICTSIFVLGIFLNHSVREMFTTVVSLAVSIIPEGLPIVMTLVLATGVWRMSKRNALVKKLQAVEALGQARVIAVDKTGTLTLNEISLSKVYINGRIFDAERFESKEIGRLAAFLGNNSSDPTEVALSVFAEKLGFKKEEVDKQYPTISQIPFDYKLKYQANLRRVDGKNQLVVLGAPEEVLKLVNTGKNIEDVLEAMSKEGLRVLAVAESENANENLKEIKGLNFVGLFAFKDTLRPEVHEAVQKAISAGIKVVMITGDHKITAQAIAKEAGIYNEGDTILTGEDIDSLSDDEFVNMLDKVSVFARVTPDHKLKIVRAYKKRGKIIAMTGDGVNDAPSLVAADLGISMGKIGTEVAKEASDIVLLDDNFASIIAAIEEGRSIYKTIKKVILYLFSTSFGEVFTIAGALFLGFPLPILAAQIVWLNFVTDGFLDVSLAMEPKEEGLLKGTFEHPKKYLIDGLTIQRMFLMAIPMTIGTLFLFSRYYQIDTVKAWTVSLTVLAVFQWFNAWNCKHESKSIFQLNPFSNMFLVGSTITVIILQLFAVYNPFMQKILHTTALNLSDWLMIIPVAASIVLVEEIRKGISRIH